MSRSSAIGLPALLLVAAAAVALALVHFIAYAVRLGVGPNLAADITTGSHAYWPAVLIATTALAAGSVIQTRYRIERAPRRPSGEEPLGRRAAGVWLALVAISVVGFVGMENAESWLSSGRLVGLAPMTWLMQPIAAAAVATALALETAAILAVVKARTDEYSNTLVGSYKTLVQAGTYSATFSQSEWAREFVSEVLAGPLGMVSGDSLSILECGAGTGVWLAQVAGLTKGRDVQVHGFDLSPAMVFAARERLAGEIDPADIRVGDMLDPAAYDFGGMTKHDVVYAYDVIQQLPSKLQERAVAAMFDHVAPGGWLVIFDHDRRSRYGRVMGIKKWLRRYFDIPLVPRFYIHARYPDLERLYRLVIRFGGDDLAIRVEPLGRKRALIARRAGTRPAVGDIRS